MKNKKEIKIEIFDLKITEEVFNEDTLSKGEDKKEGDECLFDKLKKVELIDKNVSSFG